MHDIAQFIQFLASPFVSATTSLAPAVALAGQHPQQESDFTLAAFAVSAAAITLFCIWWASYTHARWSNYRTDAQRTESQLRGAVRLRDTLLNASDLCFVVLGQDLKTPLSFGGANALLKACLAGPDAAELAPALDALLKDGVRFEHESRTADGERVALRGQPVGRHAVLYFRKIEPETAGAAVDFGAALNALPTPVWVRQHDLSLLWGNQAFLDALQMKTVESAVRANAFLHGSERDLAFSASEGAAVANVRRYVSVAGERRALSLNLNRLPDSTLLGLAMDVTEAVQAQAKLGMLADTYAGLLDRIPAAIASFDAEKRLTHYNSAYAQLWCLDEDWLGTHPRIDDILNKLRDAGRLPEQRDFAAWKRDHLRPFEDKSRYTQDVWHTAGEKCLQVQGQPDLEGGVFYIFEDVSERIRMTATIALLREVQRATLDSVSDAIAIFGPDGRLATHNSAFVRLWALEESEVADAPHHGTLAALSVVRKGRDAIWDIVAAGLASEEPERYAEWGRVTREDGKMIAVSMTHLPNGATAVQFKDVTDLQKFTEFFSEKAPAAA